MKPLTLPRGIRKRGNTYSWNKTLNGKRYYGTAPTLAEAIKAMDLAEIDNKTTLKKVTLEKAIETVLDLKMSTKSTNYYLSATSIYNTILQVFDPKQYLDSITTEDIDIAIKAWKKTGMKPGTVNNKLIMLSVLFKTGIEYNWLLKKPKLHYLTNPAAKDRFITEDEEKAILDHLIQPYKDIVAILIDTGIRCGELLGITKQNVDLENKQIMLWVTKTHKPRIVPMTDRVFTILSNETKLHESSNEKFYNVTYDELSKQWLRMKFKIGLGDDQLLTLHTCRHTCASRLIQSGIPLPVIQKWLGHRNIATTMRYAHLTNTELFRAVEVLNQA